MKHTKLLECPVVASIPLKIDRLDNIIKKFIKLKIKKEKEKILPSI